ncbi:hypothetical protein [Planctomicrobium sp. SH664]|uniref:hypothetical protein n=1 Tax=Planctomicrobium sp. SH664 TaxID=3448125 RepID=UPI003F5B5553
MSARKGRRCNGWLLVSRGSLSALVRLNVHARSTAMKQLIAALQADEAGFVLSSEMVLVGSVVALGGVTAFVGARDAVSNEFTDIANAFSKLDQSYYYGGMHGGGRRGHYKSWTAGSGFLDEDHREKYTEADFQCRETERVCEPIAAPMICTPPAVAPVVPLPCDGLPCLPPFPGPVITPGCPDGCGTIPLPAPELPCPQGDCLPQSVLPNEGSGSTSAPFVTPYPGAYSSPVIVPGSTVSVYGRNAYYGYAGPRPIVPDPPLRPVDPPHSVPFVW